MPHLTPFMYTAHYEGAKPYLVYSVDCDEPEKTSGYMQGYWACTHCGEGNHFRFYDDSYHPRFLAKCPSCKQEFIAIDDTEDIE
ncbi:hypothetical protein [Robertmurraya andreesenii]|uniref:Phage terminase large subunit GpA-like protein n=1 Tax=Anoxybacillus andreesenii TaxID=1325932 RepID=A0ABT9V1W9_9BACL|nr:hypothetical protein [Robertmurraya andreesenii]MDQ0154948.1 phage terminase large subunit GpA-like protein [Robertmurraya andreesenii]